MTEITTLLDTLLATERTTDERLDVINDLRPYLQEEQALHKIMDIAVAENSAIVRANLVHLLCEADITRLTNHQKYIDGLMHFAVMEPEPGIRYHAVEKIGHTCLYQPGAQVLVADILYHDMDLHIQQQCVEALKKCTTLAPGAIENIQRYIPLAPAVVRTDLLELAARQQKDISEPLMLSFLEPWEAMALKLQALAFLAGLAQLTEATLEALLVTFEKDGDAHVREKIVEILTAQSKVEEKVFQRLLRTLQQVPDYPAFITMVRNRLAQQPGLAASLQQLFHETRSGVLKYELLDALQQEHTIHLAVTALSDANPWVRQLAIYHCREQYAKHAGAIEPALMTALEKEPVSALRSQLLHVFLQAGKKSPAAETFLLQYGAAAAEPAIKEAITAIALSFPVQEHNRQPLLKLFVHTLRSGFAGTELKAAILQRMQAFAYSNDPELLNCLAELLQNATDFYSASAVYNQYKLQKVDFSTLAPALLQVLYRHIGYYPAGPFDEWLQVIGLQSRADAAIREQLPYLIALTGAHWLLDEADKAAQSNAFLSQFRQLMLESGMKAFLEASTLLREAWDNRTLKKADVVATYKTMLDMPYATGLTQQLVNDIMIPGKLSTPELVAASIDYLKLCPDPDGEFIVTNYLEKVGFLDLEYRFHIVHNFTQEHYNRFCRLTEPGKHHQFEKPTTFNDWQFAGWRNPYPTWPVAQLYFAMNPGDELYTILAVPPATDTVSTQSIHYIVLEHLWRKSTDKWAKFLEQPGQAEQFMQALFTLLPALDKDMHQELYDRALLIIWSRWDAYIRQLKGIPVPAPIAQGGAEVLAQIVKIFLQYEPNADPAKPLPWLMKGIHAESFRNRWEGDAQWCEAILGQVASPGLTEADAQALYEQAAACLTAGKQAEGKALLQRLLADCAGTAFVAEKKSAVENIVARL